MVTKKITSLILLSSLLTATINKPFSAGAAATGITAGILGAATILVWNLELDPKNKAEKSPIQQPIAKNRFAQFVQNHTKTMLDAARVIAGGLAIGFVGYHSHPIIKAILQSQPPKDEQFTLPNILEDKLKWLELTPEQYRTITENELKTKWRKLTVKWHPDKQPVEKQAEYSEKFKEFTIAHEFLKTNLTYRDWWKPLIRQQQFSSHADINQFKRKIRTEIESKFGTIENNPNNINKEYIQHYQYELQQLVKNARASIPQDK